MPTVISIQDATAGAGQPVDLASSAGVAAVAIASTRVEAGAVQLEGSLDGFTWQLFGNEAELQPGSGVNLEARYGKHKYVRPRITKPVVGGTVTVVFVE
jgi:hypothetical protein